ncbi:MAG: hypothetical protein LBR57_02095 [Alistipes sp.]|jgi:hypothetical protein|nr:hypothetical protein [Alistipes sp.]
MKLLARIVDRVNIRVVRFTDGGAEVSTVTHGVSSGKPATGTAAPSVMVVCGNGVITKEASSAVAATVTSDPATFIWTISGGMISFTRRDRLTELSAPEALYVECLPESDDHTLSGVVERFRSKYLTWRHVLSESALAAMVAKRLMLPVLGVVLAVLIANFVVSASVRENFQLANAELAALRKTSSTDAVTDERRRATLKAFSIKLPRNASRISDMIAAAVPEKITLSELAIAPLTKAVETGKHIAQNERLIFIRGEASASEAITEFTTALTKLDMGTVRLASVEQDRERAILTFRIEITL